MDDETLSKPALESRISGPAMMDDAGANDLTLSAPLTSQQVHLLLDMEALSSIGNVATLLAIAAKLVENVYQVAQSVRDYRKELNTLGSDIATLTGLLLALKNSLACSGGSERHHTGTPSSRSSSGSGSSRSSFSDTSYEMVAIGKPDFHLGPEL